MPFGIGKSDEEKAAEAARDQRRAQAEAAIRSGGIPQEARNRLAQIGRGGAPFTSTFSVNDFLFARELGVRPISQVLGSSVYHVGWQRTGWQSSFGKSQIKHMDVLSHAWNDARSRALSRMEQEATLVGAHAVVEVKVERGKYDWATDAIEFVAAGTAVAIEGEAAPERPALSTLAGEEFWMLRRAGYRPVGVAGGSSLWLVRPGWETNKLLSGSMFGGWRNQEYTDFTNALHQARYMAHHQFNWEAQSLGAEGVIDVTFDQRPELKVIESNDSKSYQFWAHVHVLGTAVVAVDRDAASRVDIPRYIDLRKR